MSSPNVKPSQDYPVAAEIPPQSLAAAGTATSSYIQIPPETSYAAVLLLCGALGSGSEQIDVLQATDTSGTSSKALVTNLATNAVNNTTSQADVRTDTTDIANGFNCIAIKITNTGGSGALVAASLAFGPAAYKA